MADIDELISELYPEEQRKQAPTTDSLAEQSAVASTHNFDASDDEAASKGPTAAGAHSAPHRRVVPWPTLPPTLKPSPACPGGTMTLASRVSVEAAREQQRLLYLNQAQLLKPAVCRPQYVGQDDDGGAWCPYLRCRHCDHVVVRKEGFYWSRGLAPLTDCPEVKAVAKPKLSAAHSFDDSDSGDDDVMTAQASPATPGSLQRPRDDDAMYILMRYHYPDFSAFPDDVLVKEQTAPSRPSAAAEPSAAAYCCQCTWVSVVDIQWRVPTAAVGGPVQLPSRPSQLKPEPTSRASTSWVCKGHTC
jgi:hypothetical protein